MSKNSKKHKRLRNRRVTNQNARAFVRTNRVPLRAMVEDLDWALRVTQFDVDGIRHQEELTRQLTAEEAERRRWLREDFEMHRIRSMLVIAAMVILWIIYLVSSQAVN